jgi:hypothetical protein
MTGFIAPYTFTSRDYGQYSAIADSHTLQFIVTQALGFSVFTSRILATDLSQSHYKFKSHIKSSLHSLIHFLPFLLNHLGLLSPELDPNLDNNSLKWTLLQLNSLNLWQQLTLCCSMLPNSSLWPLCLDHAENKPLFLRRHVYWSVA